MVIRLTPAAVSALECAGLDLRDESLTPAERVLVAALTGPSGFPDERLEVTRATRDAIVEALNLLSNAEDATAQETTDPESRKYAGRAARALANLMTKVMRLELTQ